MTKVIQFQCVEVRQPIGLFYIGAVRSDDLIAISYADVRRIEERDIEKYLGIQRTLNQGRVNDIAKYVQTIDATFPTAVILAVSGDDAVYDAKAGQMSITKDDQVAKIIDGQHRIAGLKTYSGPDPFMVNVAIFIDMDIEDQATVFATINLSQTKVSKSLAYDLFEYARHRSPQKTAHNAALLLNREDGSAFKDRIKMLGTATPGKKAETITQAAFIEALLPYLTNNKLEDRDAIQRGRKLPQLRDSLTDDRIFRNFFVTKADEQIVLNVWNYFQAVSKRWPVAWNEKEAGNILNRSTGFSALMKFLRIAYRGFGKADVVVPTKYFTKVFDAVRLKDEDFTPAMFPPGSSGSSKLLKTLSSHTEGVRGG